jgi:hypothetical protein
LIRTCRAYRIVYVDPSGTVWSELVVPVLATMDRRTLMSLSGLHRGTIERYVTGSMRPHRRNQVKLTELALEHARARLGKWGVEVVRDTAAVLHSYLSVIAEESDRRSMELP